MINIRPVCLWGGVGTVFMMALSLLLATLLLAAATSSSKTPQRIVGGEDTTIENYPALVATEGRGLVTGIWSQNCAANVLTSRWVLSAAHCFSGSLYLRENRRIRAGSTIRNTGGQVLNIIREHNHPTWGTPGQGNDGDITVVQLDGALNLDTPVVKPATLINQGFVLPDNYPVIHAGWGTTEQGGFASSHLQHVTITKINRELCKDRYNNFPGQPLIVSDNMICAGILDIGGKDACQGDSGGPLYFRDAEDTLFLYGLVSWGLGCAHETYPGVNTAVSSYVDWIVETAR